MNIDKLKATMELKAVQNFSTSNSTASESSTFQDILNEILTDDETSALSEPLTSTSSTEVNSIPLTSMPPLSLLKASNNIDQIINQAAQQYSVPAKLIKAVIQQESSFNTNAVSKTGAAGLMQLMPGTAKSLGVSDVFDPEQNILAGSKYIKQLLDKYDGKIDLALAAYNAGPANVDKYGGIPPFDETANYVRKVSDLYYT
ncbi:lytic transglycosylase domain-containing protein [Neobacillus sp. PS3-12]|uniref:lytic transglycosylase domain-containing protein n=1 Tax=Neobacillus sp. PS3-12 TaxID=3070677 RepID=UPI0027E02933|nr:lytic transglycosylase domain-containing protein [Neobacillus sp. PS3-12]WML51647.1 lytic transglycosylase domain-containing protein [Neobacillus sp. PS3-12]